MVDDNPFGFENEPPSLGPPLRERQRANLEVAKGGGNNNNHHNNPPPPLFIPPEIPKNNPLGGNLDYLFRKEIRQME